MKKLKTRVCALLLALVTALTLLPVSALAAVSSGSGITPTTDPNLWSTRLTSTGAAYSYRPPMAAGKQLYCMDLGYSYHYGTNSFLNSYTYQSATGKDSDALWEQAVAKTGLGEMSATVKENAKWMMSYIADYTGDIPGSLFMALQTYLWDNQSNKSASGDTSGDIDAGGFANADTYDTYVGYYNWMLQQKANEDRDLQAQVEACAKQGITAVIEEDDASKWAVLARSNVSGRQAFFAYHTKRVVTPEDPQGGKPDVPGGDEGIIIIKVDADTGRGLSGAQFKLEGISTSYQSTFTTGANGAVTIIGLAAGSYKATEIVAPAGYTPDTTPQTFYYYETTPVSLTFQNHSKTTVTLTKTTVSGAVLAGCTFNIYRDGQIIGSDTTDAAGKITVTGVVEGLYAFVETSAPEGYQVDATPHEVYVDVADGSKEYTVSATNAEKPDMEIVKLDAQTGDPIRGATFSVKGVTNAFSTSVTTGTDGRGTLPALEAGVYVVREESVPEPYVVSNTEQTVALQAGKTSVVTFTDYQKPGLEIIKRNIATGDSIPNVSFKIEQIDGSYATSATTDETGRIFLENIPVGSYTVTETAVPEGIILGTIPQTVALKAGETSTVTFFNAEKADLKIVKTDAITGEPLAGVTFRIKYADGSTITTEATDAAGEILLEDRTPGVYEIWEHSVPDGYLLDKTPQLITLEPNQTGTVRFQNYPKPTLTVNKVDSITKDPIQGAKFHITYASNDTFTGEINDLGTLFTDENGQIQLSRLTDGWYRVTEVEPAAGYAIKGPATQDCYIQAGTGKVLTFENTPLSALVVYKYDSVTGEAVAGAVFQVKYLGGTSGTGGTVIGTYKTSANGSFTVTGLKAGTYIVEELASDSGHVIDTAPQTAYISGKEQDVVQLYFGNSPKGSLLIKKINSVTHAPLSDVEFMVTTSNGTVVGSANGKFTTDSAGSILISGLNPGESIVVKETIAKDGYVLDDTPQTAKIIAGETVTLEFRNQPVGGGQIIKVDADSGKRIKGVQFEVARMNGERIGVYTTDSTGVIILPELADGWYTATEVKAAKGYLLDATPHNFEVRNGKTTSIIVENTKASSILIHKVDSVTGKGIYGVTFLVSDRSGNPIGQYTSDQNGYVYIDKELTDGKYLVREIEAADGYALDTTPRTFYVEYGATSEILWKNTPTMGQIQITKKSADDNPYNGLPAGTLLPGATFELYNRAGTLVDTIVSGSNGVAISKTLPLGRYTIRETKAPAFYSPTTATMEAEIEFSGQIVRLEVLNQSCYTNVSVSKRGYTQVVPGQTIRYDFKNIANNSTVSLSSFYWRDTLPTDAVRLQKIVTGTWNQRLSYKVVFKTNLNGYRTLADNLSTAKNNVLDASPAALGLASDEYVTEYMFVFGTVKSGFAQADAPYIFCTVNGWLHGGYQFANKTDVGGLWSGQWIMASDRWVTTVYGKTPTLPKTGY